VKKINILFLFIYLLFLLSACTSSIDPQAIADLVEIDYPMGNQLVLNQSYFVGIHNHSDQCIIFPNDYDIKLYMKNGKEEKEITNIVKYYGDVLKLTEEGTYFPDNVIYFSPDIKSTDYSASTSFYATIQGYLCDDKETIINKTFDFSVKQ